MKDKKLEDIIGAVFVALLGAVVIFCLFKAGMAAKQGAEDHRSKIRESIAGCRLSEIRIGVDEPSATWTCDDGRWLEISEHEAREAGIWPL